MRKTHLCCHQNASGCKRAIRTGTDISMNNLQRPNVDAALWIMAKTDD